MSKPQNSFFQIIPAKKNYPKIKTKSNVRIERNNYMSRPQIVVKNSPLWVKNDPKIKSKSKVRAEENIGNKSHSTAWVHLKTVFEPFPDPQKSPILQLKIFQLQISSTSLQLQVFSTSNFFNLKFIKHEISATSNFFHFSSTSNFFNFKFLQLQIH